MIDWKLFWTIAMGVATGMAFNNFFAGLGAVMAHHVAR